MEEIELNENNFEWDFSDIIEDCHQSKIFSSFNIEYFIQNLSLSWKSSSIIDNYQRSLSFSLINRISFDDDLNEDYQTINLSSERFFMNEEKYKEYSLLRLSSKDVNQQLNMFQSKLNSTLSIDESMKSSDDSSDSILNQTKEISYSNLSSSFLKLFFQSLKRWTNQVCSYLTGKYSRTNIDQTETIDENLIESFEMIN